MGTVGVIIGVLLIAVAVLIAVKFVKDKKINTNKRTSNGGGGGTGGGSTTPQENKK
tara:strand:- start:484 stop:651 length:168 start_codon:yes stop_codon:yes gene_type:complete